VKGLYVRATRKRLYTDKKNPTKLGEIKKGEDQKYEGTALLLSLTYQKYQTSSQHRYPNH